MTAPPQNAPPQNDSPDAADPIPDQCVHHGRARRLSQIPWAGWRKAYLRVLYRLTSDNLDIAAAGVAFHGLLALVPALAATLSLYAVFAQPSDVRELVTSTMGLLPPNARGLIKDLLDNTVESSSSSLTFTAIFSLLLALWSANRGMKALVIAVNIAYSEDDERGFLRLNLLGMSLTLGAMGVFAIAAFSIVALPHLLSAYRVGDALMWSLAIARWPILFAVFLGGIAVIYRVGPVRDSTRWRWVSAGAITATVLWLLASGVLSLYTTYLADMGKVYGPIGGVVALLLWFYVSAWVILLGAELNAELERQTYPDIAPARARQAVTSGPAGPVSLPKSE